jgi:hypothetical protein
MRPSERSQRCPHGSEADANSALTVPVFDSVDEARIRVRLRMYSQPVQVDTPRIVAAAWLMLNVTAFALAA